MKPDIGIAQNNLKQINEMLSVVLSNETVLYIKTRKFHWNISGESFMELHRLFEEHYKEIEIIIDEVAERIGKLGGKTIGTMSEFSKYTSLKEYPGKYPESKEMIKELLKDHETVIRELRKAQDECGEKLKDAGTADFLTGIMESHESIAWVLRRYLN
ncbi:MAG: DNA starvation/stationary phase protection protein [Bacteroidota bacterium]|nr:DNA starvation/stationary phase protection protein [Bacteroidota bacterium]